MLHGELVGTNSPQARNLFIKGCSPSRASLLKGYCFQLGNRMGSWRTMMTSSAWWAHPGIPCSHAWELILSSHSFWSLSIGEDVMGSSVVTRSCSALGDEKLPITRVVPSLESISSVQFSCSVVSDSLRPRESQHTRPPCPSPTPGAYPNSCPSSQ